MEFLNNVLKNNFDVKDIMGGLMGILNPNHVDLDFIIPLDGQIVKHTSFT